MRPQTWFRVGCYTGHVFYNGVTWSWRIYKKSDSGVEVVKANVCVSVEAGQRAVKRHLNKLGGK